MKKQSVFTGKFLVVLILLIAWACASDPEDKLKDEARHYAKLKCEMRAELDKMMGDTLGTYPQALIDSVRKARNQEIRLIREKYQEDADLLKRFNELVQEEAQTLDECKGLINKPREKKDREKGKAQPE
ncbi:MAG: hypothetical protein KKA81_10655 [Bacteroidetes bacterium]|nr:hypothetical protein [Bacteroidota bacterium]